LPVAPKGIEGLQYLRIAVSRPPRLAVSRSVIFVIDNRPAFFYHMRDSFCPAFQSKPHRS